MQFGQILLWMVVVYVAIGVATLIVVRGIAWLQAEGAESHLSWRDELKAAFWMILLWPLLALVAIVVVAMIFTVGSIVRKLRRNPSQFINPAVLDQLRRQTSVEGESRPLPEVDE